MGAKIGFEWPEVGTTGAKKHLRSIARGNDP